MNTHATTSKTSKETIWPRLASILLIGTLLDAASPILAQGFGSPDECQAYTGEAHVKCLYTFIEMQQKRLVQIEEALHGQTSGVEPLQLQPDQQLLTTQDTPPPITIPPPKQMYIYPPVAPGYAYAGYGYPGVPYGYPWYGSGLGFSLYPGLGLSLGFGSLGYYGRPFYTPRYIYRPFGFYGPRFSHGNRFYSGPRVHSGARFYSGPRSFGNRSFGNRSFGHRSFGNRHR